MYPLTTARINLKTGSGMEWHNMPLISLDEIPGLGDDLAKLGDGSIYVTEYVTGIVEFAAAKEISSNAPYTIWTIHTVGTDSIGLDYREKYFIATKDE